MYHQLFTLAQKFFIKKRKYFPDTKKNPLAISNSLFLMFLFYFRRRSLKNN